MTGPTARGDTRHRYPPRSLVTDYLRSGIGMLLTFGPLAVTQPLPAVTGILAAFGTLFLLFGVRTVIRHNTVVTVSDQGVEAGWPAHVKLRWEELSRLKLSYFSTKRDRAGGWMQLRLKSGRRAVRIDSSIEDFATVVTAAARAARAAGVTFEPTTLQNLEALGLFSVAAGATPEGEAPERRPEHRPEHRKADAP